MLNPVATGMRHGARGHAARSFAPLGLEWVLATAGPGDAGRLAAHAAAEGADIVVAMGGDGTVAEAAAALTGGSVALLPLSAGNANVFARGLGWPARTGQAIDAAARALAAPATRALVLGEILIEGRARTFIVNAGAGIDAETVRWVEERPWRKRRLRQAGYAAGIVRAVAGARALAPMRVAVDGAPAHALTSAAVAVGSPYSYAGARPLDAVPGAAHDGELRWLGLRRAHLGDVGAVLAGSLRGGTHLTHPGVVHGVVRHELVVRAAVPVALQADGEPLGLHAEALIRPGRRLDVVRPPALK